MSNIKDVPVGKIKVGDHELRMGVGDETLYDLRVSIRRIGVIVPVVVTSDGDQFVLVAGHRRYRSAVLEGLKTIPAIVRDLDPAVSKELSFAENMFRQDLTPVEVAAGVQDVLNQGIMSIPELAAAMHKTENWIAHQLAILSWPADVLEVIHSDKLSVAAASNIAMVTDDVYRTFLLRQALENGATARTTAAWLQAWRASAPAEAAVQAEPLPLESRPVPMVPQAPCLCCGNVYRTDQLSHVPICSGCIQTIRNIS